MKMATHSRPSGRCLYCGISVTRKTRHMDHVPSKCLLVKPFPPNLKKVTSCLSCNRGFSSDEEYFLVVLAQIGSCPELTDLLAEDGQSKEKLGRVFRALEASQKFAARFEHQLSVGEDGRVYLIPELERVNNVIRKTVTGLYWLRYNRRLSPSQMSNLAAFPWNIHDQRPTQVFLLAYNERFQPKRWTVVQRGVFSYLFVRDPSAPGQLVCLCDFFHTLWTVASVPFPTRQGKHAASSRHSCQLVFPGV